MPLSITEKIERIKEKAIAVGYTITGCTELEIEKLRERQGVDYLPEMYRQLMLLMGREGLSKLLMGPASCESLGAEALAQFERMLRNRGICDPKDFFVIMVHAGYQFFFFRTKDQVPDPPVWGQWDDNYFYRLSDSLSQFILEELEGKKERWRRRMNTAYFYDPAKDNFYGVPHPDPYDW